MNTRITAIADDGLRVGGVDNGIYAHIRNVVAYDLKGHRRHSFHGDCGSKVIIQENTVLSNGRNNGIKPNVYLWMYVDRCKEI